MVVLLAIFSGEIVAVTALGDTVLSSHGCSGDLVLQDNTAYEFSNCIPPGSITFVGDAASSVNVSIRITGGSYVPCMFLHAKDSITSLHVEISNIGRPPPPHGSSYTSAQSCSPTSWIEVSAGSLQNISVLVSNVSISESLPLGSGAARWLSVTSSAHDIHAVSIRVTNSAISLSKRCHAIVYVSTLVTNTSMRSVFVNAHASRLECHWPGKVHRTSISIVSIGQAATATTLEAIHVALTDCTMMLSNSYGSSVVGAGYITKSASLLLVKEFIQDASIRVANVTTYGVLLTHPQDQLDTRGPRVCVVALPGSCGRNVSIDVSASFFYFEAHHGDSAVAAGEVNFLAVALVAVDSSLINRSVIRVSNVFLNVFMHDTTLVPPCPLSDEGGIDLTGTLSNVGIFIVRLDRGTDSQDFSLQVQHSTLNLSSVQLLFGNPKEAMLRKKVSLSVGILSIPYTIEIAVQGKDTYMLGVSVFLGAIVGAFSQVQRGMLSIEDDCRVISDTIRSGAFGGPQLFASNDPRIVFWRGFGGIAGADIGPFLSRSMIDGSFVDSLKDKLTNASIDQVDAYVGDYLRKLNIKYNNDLRDSVVAQAKEAIATVPFPANLSQALFEKYPSLEELKVPPTMSGSSIYLIDGPKLFSTTLGITDEVPFNVTDVSFLLLAQSQVEDCRMFVDASVTTSSTMLHSSMRASSSSLQHRLRRITATSDFLDKRNVSTAAHQIGCVVLASLVSSVLSRLALSMENTSHPPESTTASGGDALRILSVMGSINGKLRTVEVEMVFRGIVLTPAAHIAAKEDSGMGACSLLWASCDSKLIEEMGLVNPPLLAFSMSGITLRGVQVQDACGLSGGLDVGGLNISASADSRWNGSSAFPFAVRFIPKSSTRSKSVSSTHPPEVHPSSELPSTVVPSTVGPSPTTAITSTAPDVSSPSPETSNPISNITNQPTNATNHSSSYLDPPVTLHASAVSTAAVWLTGATMIVAAPCVLFSAAGGGAILGDFQLFAALGASDCASPSLRQSSQPAQVVLSPFFDLDEPTSAVLGNGGLLLGIIALHATAVGGLGCFQRQREIDMRQRKRHPPPSPYVLLRFPALSIAATAIFLPGLVGYSVRVLVLSNSLGSILAGCCGFVVAIAASICIYAFDRSRRAGLLRFTMYTARQHRTPCLCGLPLPAAALPLGRWGPTEIASTHGRLRSAIHAHTGTYHAHTPLALACASALIGGVPLSSPGGCVAQWSVHCIVFLSAIVSIILCKPCRVPLTNVSQVSMLAILLVLAGVSLAIVVVAMMESGDESVDSDFARSKSLEGVVGAFSCIGMLCTAIRASHAFLVFLWERRVNAQTLVEQSSLASANSTTHSLSKEQTARLLLRQRHFAQSAQSPSIIHNETIRITSELATMSCDRDEQLRRLIELICDCR